MPVMVFGYEFEDVIDVHLDLFYQFGFEDNVVVDDLLVGFLMRTPLLVEIDVQALVVLQVAQTQHIIIGEIVESLQDVAQPQNRAEQGEEILLRLFSDDFLAQGEPLKQLRDLLGVCSEIFRIWLKHHRALGVLVPEQSQGVIHLLPQITETDDVAKGLLEAFATLKTDMPIVIRLTGTNEKEGRELLKGSQFTVATTMGDAGKKAVELAAKVAK